MKKKLFALLLALTLCLTGCSQQPTQPTEPSGTTEPITEPATQPSTQAPGKDLFTEDTLPRIDGSTATIPLSEGLVKYLLDYTPEQAQDFVHHNTTHYAYENLINGDCDIIFVTPPSDQELQQMADSGQQFEVVQVVRDAFVFLVNSQNPVENLSLEDVRAIYRGEIRNWKEVGGDDLTIIPFQREDNSGSQTLMYKLLLPKGQLASPPTEMVIQGMGMLVDKVSDYDGGRGSIGYSVFYYAGGMYTSDGSKLIAVDGVQPTAQTVADGTYPLVDGYYAVFRKDEPQDGPVRKLLRFLQSDAGQDLAENEGYVPLRAE